MWKAFDEDVDLDRVRKEPNRLMGAAGDPAALFRFLLDRRNRGEGAVLVTLVMVDGGAARGPGSQVAVGADGAVLGSFSAGCVEAAVVTEAREALRAGEPRRVRFGAGSPFLDIRLPCGGGIELWFLPDPPAAALEQVVALLDERRPAALRLRPDGTVTAAAAAADERTGWEGAGFLCRIEPALRLLVAGHGAEPIALLRLAGGLGADRALLSPDPDCVAEARAMGVAAERLLPGTGELAGTRCDRRTAVVLLFHDHDWELRVLRRAIEADAFFVGAMGSRRTHAERCRRLAAAGVPAASIARVVGPVGLIEAARDPETLAVSILAQVVAEQARTARAVSAAAAGTDAPARPPDAPAGMTALSGGLGAGRMITRTARVRGSGPATPRTGEARR